MARALDQLGRPALRAVAARERGPALRLLAFGIHGGVAGRHELRRAYGRRVTADLGERGWAVVSGGASASTPPRTGARWPPRASRSRSWPAASTIPTRRATRTCSRPSPPRASWPASGRRDARPARTRFLIRNRVIAALASGTVIVEAGERSGALNTARHAADLGKPLMAVPGPVTSAQSAGCHRIIREWGATCVTRAAEIIELLSPLSVPDALAPGGRADPTPGREAACPPATTARSSRRRHASRDDLDADSARVLDACPPAAVPGLPPSRSRPE